MDWKEFLDNIDPAAPPKDAEVVRWESPQIYTSPTTYSPHGDVYPLTLPQPRYRQKIVQHRGTTVSNTYVDQNHPLETYAETRWRRWMGNVAVFCIAGRKVCGLAIIVGYAIEMMRLIIWHHF